MKNQIFGGLVLMFVATWLSILIYIYLGLHWLLVYLCFGGISACLTALLPYGPAGKANPLRESFEMVIMLFFYPVIFLGTFIYLVFFKKAAK